MADPADDPLCGFGTLDEVSGARAAVVRDAIRAGKLPAASLIAADGTERYPRDLLVLVDQAGGVDALRGVFEARYVVASDTFGVVAGPDELDDVWDEYLAGRLGARLVTLTPEHAALERRLADAVTRLVAAPDAADRRWCERLRSRVEQLESTTRPLPGRDPFDDPAPRDAATLARTLFPRVFGDADQRGS